MPFVLRLLDALVRLEEYEAFERAVPLVGSAIEDPAVAAVTLGELYLARGFYRLAGDLALKALDHGAKDARTLALLGKSAVAEGLFADALPILEACLELDPSQTIGRASSSSRSARGSPPSIPAENPCKSRRSLRHLDG